jgi:glycerol dehydrogenase
MAEAQQGQHRLAGRSFGGPGKYVQRAGELDRLAHHLRGMGKSALLLVDGFVLETMGKAIAHSFEGSGIAVRMERFGGECCAEEIERVTSVARAAKAEIVVGIGGGKTADTAKLAAIANDARIAIVPTIASTDAPCSAIAVRYTAEGVYQESMFLSRNPDAVIVDSAVIARAPARFLVAGIGDALSTWFEARSNLDSRSGNLVQPKLPAPAAGIAIARACHDVLMRDALAARIAVEKGLLTPAVENIIEANTLLSGLGFENCGVSAAHGIHDGLTVLHETHGFFHGEKVAFGVLCLLMLEGRPLAEIEETARFCRALGLPTRLADLNLGAATPDDIEKVAEASLKPGSATYKVAVPLSPAIVRDAILSLDAFTSEFINHARA